MQKDEAAEEFFDEVAEALVALLVVAEGTPADDVGQAAEVEAEGLVAGLVFGEELIGEFFDGEGVDEIGDGGGLAGEREKALGGGGAGFTRAEDVGEALRMGLAGGEGAVGLDAGLAGDEAKTVFADLGMEIKGKRTVDGGFVDEAAGEFTEADAVARDVGARAGEFDLKNAEAFAVGEG